jgi:hypothetical protein
MVFPEDQKVDGNGLEQRGHDAPARYSSVAVQRPLSAGWFWVAPAIRTHRWAI